MKIILFLMAIESLIRKAEKKKGSTRHDDDRAIAVEYDQLQKGLEPYQKAAPKPTPKERLQAFGRNITNVARNAFDNTVGYGIAKAQNLNTKRHLQRKPGTKDKVVYLMHGMFQNEGSQHRFASQLRERGYQPYHLKGHHHESIEDNVDKAFEQIDKLHKETGLKKPSERTDKYSGHSSGANVGIYMSGDERAKKYGISPPIQARAPGPYGIKAETIGQKLLMPLASEDNVKYTRGKKAALKMSKVEPKIEVQVVAGKHDQLVRPADAYYHKAGKHYVIDHPDSTHFGTSGGNKLMNQAFIDLLEKKPDKKYEKKYHGNYRANA